MQIGFGSKKRKGLQAQMLTAEYKVVVLIQIALALTVTKYPKVNLYSGRFIPRPIAQRDLLALEFGRKFLSKIPTTVLPVAPPETINKACSVSLLPITITEKTTPTVILLVILTTALTVITIGRTKIQPMPTIIPKHCSTAPHRWSALPRVNQVAGTQELPVDRLLVC
jgi:hypothetical protein